jgi:hypothetical protein
MEGWWRVAGYWWRVDAKAESGKNEGFSGLGIRDGGKLEALKVPSMTEAEILNKCWMITI